MLPNPHTGNLSSMATYRNDPKPRQISTVINAKPNGTGNSKTTHNKQSNLASNTANYLNTLYGKKS